MDPLQDIGLTLVLVTFAASFAACFYSSLSGGGAGLILGALLGSYAGASVGIKRGNRFLRMMFLGTAAVTGVILLYPWLRDLVGA
jgi:uncharacterized membrane protein YfcA